MENEINTIVNENYIFDLKYNIRSKTRYKISSDVMQTLSYIFNMCSVIFAFSAGFFDNLILSFVAGCCGTIGITLSKFSSYLMNESKERTMQVNELLKNRNIHEIPDIAVDNNEI